MAFYGYNPADYKPDFSWIGDIGDALAQTAHKLPELVEYSRMVKENRFFKEKYIEGANKWIDNLDPQTAISTALGMGIKLPSGTDSNAHEVAKEAIRGRLDETALLIPEKATPEQTETFLREKFSLPLFNAVNTYGRNNITDTLVGYGNLPGIKQEDLQPLAEKGKRSKINKTAIDLLSSGKYSSVEDIAVALSQEFGDESYETIMGASKAAMLQMQKKETDTKRQAAFDASQSPDASASSVLNASGGDPDKFTDAFIQDRNADMEQQKIDNQANMFDREIASKLEQRRKEFEYEKQRNTIKDIAEVRTRMDEESKIVEQVNAEVLNLFKGDKKIKTVDQAWKKLKTMASPFKQNGEQNTTYNQSSRDLYESFRNRINDAFFAYESASALYDELTNGPRKPTYSSAASGSTGRTYGAARTTGDSSSTDSTGDILDQYRK